MTFIAKFFTNEYDDGGDRNDDNDDDAGNLN